MLDIIEKDWSGVFIQGLPKKSIEEAMWEQSRRKLKETWCKTCSVSHSTEVVVALCPEGQQLTSQLRKLLTSRELRKFFDKRAAVRKVFGSADLLLIPLCVQFPICVAVVALGHLNDIMIKKDHFWKHIYACQTGSKCRGVIFIYRVAIFMSTLHYIYPKCNMYVQN